MRVTLGLAGITMIVFIFQAIIPGFTENFSLTPTRALSGEWWQFITYIFFHGGSLHLVLNMFVLGIFGMGVENRLGERLYLALFLLSGLGSAGLHIGLTGVSEILLLGASGAVFGVMTAYAFLYPKNWIIMFPGIPMPAMLAVVVFAGAQLFFGFSGLQPGIANFGHLGGIVTGLAIMLLWRQFYKPPRIEDSPSRTYEYIWE